MSFDYSPKGIGRLVDEAITLYRANFRTLTLPALFFLMPLTLALSIAQSQTTALVVRSVQAQAEAGSGPQAFPTLLGMVGALYGLVFLVVTIVGLGVLYYDSCLLNATPQLLAREPIPPAEFLKGGRHRFGYLILAVWILGIIAGFGYLFLVIPGLVVLAFGALVMPITVIERAAIGDVFTRSFSLVSGNFWRVVGFFVAASAIVYTLQSAFTSLAVVPTLLLAMSRTSVQAVPSLPWQVFTGVMQGGAYVVGAPLQGLCLLAIYLDLRARREGMDLLARAQRLSALPS